MRAIAMLMSPFHWVRSSHWKRRVEHFCSTRSAPTRGVPSAPRHSSVPSTRMLGLERTKDRSGRRATRLNHIMLLCKLPQ